MGADRNQWQFPKNEANKIPGWRADGKGLENKIVPLIGLSLASEIRDFLDTAPYVDTRTELKALDTSKDTTAILTEDGREGIFNWKAGDYAAEIAADTLEGVYIKADDIAATDGAWVRFFEGEVNVKWFGAKGDDATTADRVAIQTAFNNHPYVFIPAGTYLQTEAIGLPSDTIVRGAGRGVTILKFPDGTDKVHHNIVSANALSLDARMATDENVDTLVGDYVENFAIYDLTLEGNTYNRVKTYNDREQGTALELHKVRNFIVRRVEAIRGPQHCINVRAGTNSFNQGYDYVALYPSYYGVILECPTNDQEIDDGITTHDSEYLWIERCVVKLDRAKNDLARLTASNGIEIDDGSRYVWVKDNVVDGAFGAFQAKGHENTPPAHHVWFINNHGENVHHGFLLTAVNSTTTDPDDTRGTCHDIHVIGCSLKNVYNFVNASAWLNSSNYVQMQGTRHVTIKDLRIVGKTEDMPNTDPAAGALYWRFRDNNYHTVIDGVHFSAVDERSDNNPALIQAQTLNQSITIRNIKIDEYTHGPAILTTDGGVNWTVEDINLLSGSATYPVVDINGVGTGSLRARRISGVGSQAPCSLGGVLCPGYEEKDVSTRATAAESVYQRLVAGLDSANASGMQGANLGTTYNYSISGTLYRMGGIVVTPNNTNSITGTSITTRVGLYGRASGGSDMTALYWAQEGSFYPNLDNTYSAGQQSRRFSNVYGTNLRPGAGSVIWTSGAGTPEAAVTAAVGSLYTDTTGGKLYVKATGTGNTGWVVAGTQT